MELTIKHTAYGINGDADITIKVDGKSSSEMVEQYQDIMNELGLAIMNHPFSAEASNARTAS
jgi:hypothetical protein